MQEGVLWNVRTVLGNELVLPVDIFWWVLTYLRHSYTTLALFVVTASGLRGVDGTSQAESQSGKSGSCGGTPIAVRRATAGQYWHPRS